jgi:uncharacterized protein (TIGR02145 family)
MKSIFRITGFILAIILFFACNEEKQVLPPMVSTSPVTEILYYSAVAGGIVTEDGGGQIFARGVCWGTEPNPTTENSITVNGAGTGAFWSYIDGLTSGTTYHLRAYVTNSTGTEYGDDIMFTTHITGVKFNPDLVYGSLADVEGKLYKTITIGTQVWMAENLKTTRFNDGATIPEVTGYAQWSDMTSPAYSWHNNNDSLYENIYGAYYNWFSVSTGKLCPAGWHVPSDNEWQVLISYLGGDKVAGSRLKEAGTNNWISSNKNATNESGFTALPAGFRGAVDGTFAGQGDYGAWWSATEMSQSVYGTAWCRWVHGDTTLVVRNEVFKKDGFTIRCLKD